MKGGKRAPIIGLSTWRIWVSANGVRHLVLRSNGYCLTCGRRDHNGKKEIRNA